MVVAKFHIVGEKSLWYKARVQEEMAAQGLDGSVMDAGDDSLVLVVEGKSNKIKDLYDNLNQSIPQGITLTEIVFRHTRETSDDSSETLKLLRNIETNTRKINQKLDILLRKKSAPDTEEPDTEEYTMESKEHDEGTAESSFAAMFGD